MNLVKCKNGHFYDADSFRECPHCGGGAGNGAVNVTMPIHHTGDDEVTVSLKSPTKPQNATMPESSKSQLSSLQSMVNEAAKTPTSAVADDDNKTIGFFTSSMGQEPVVGWLVCITGKHFGEDFRLTSGRNFIGRGNDMDISLSKDQTVSRQRHAIVVYEPKGNLFLVQPGDSKELCYLNDQVVLGAQMLKANDKLLVGKTELMLIPCCNTEFNWDDVKDGMEKEE